MNRFSSAQLVRQLGSLDKSFVQENAEMLQDASIYPHAVMMQYAGHLARRFGAVDEFYRFDGADLFLLDQTINLLESALRKNDSETRGMIRVSFIEQIYDENPKLFEQLESRSSPSLRHEMLVHKTERMGLTIATVIRQIYGDSPPANLADMTGNPCFIAALASEGLPLCLNDTLLDAWEKPYYFTTRSLPETHTRLLCVVSEASLRGCGEDIESCIPI